MESELILDNMYRDLAIHTPLNVVFKQFFTELKSVDECEQLQLSLYQVREHLIQQHQTIVDKLKSHDVTRALGFRLIQDKASSSGGHFLRWRTTLGLKNQLKGGLVWKTLLEDTHISIVAKKRVTQMEKERLILNMQMSVLNSMLRQLSDVIEKQIDIEQEYNRQTLEN